MNKGNDKRTTTGAISSISNDNRRCVHTHATLRTSVAIRKDLKVMIDSGNTLIQGIGISEKTHQLLGGQWHKRPKRKIIAGTSKQGAGLTVLGYAAETTLKINGLL